MRILITSDTHYHPKTRAAVDRMRDRIMDEHGACDVLLILGDIGEEAPMFAACLHALRPVAALRLCIPGNHDFYKSSGYSTDALRKMILPAMAKEQDYGYGAQVVRHGNVVFVLNSCWHNLSWCSPYLKRQLKKSDLEDAYRKGIMDAVKMSTPYRELHQINMQEFVGQMSSVQRIIKPGDHLIIGSHWPILHEMYKPFIPKSSRAFVDTSNPEQMAQFAHATDSAFLAPEFGDVVFETITKMPVKPEKVFFFAGHTHQGEAKIIERNGQEATSIIVGSDYGKPIYIILEL